MIDRKEFYSKHYGHDLCVVRDPGECGLLMLALKPYRHLSDDCVVEEWGSYNYLCLDKQLFPEITWETEPLHVTLAQVNEENASDAILWLGRNEDTSLCISKSKPYRNSVNPWWSSPNKMNWYDDDLFPELDWSNEPILVHIKAIDK